MSSQRNNLIYVKAKIESEGFDYAFRDYSDFSDVLDEEFHELRKAYIAAADALSNYIDKWANDLDDEYYEDNE